MTHISKMMTIVVIACLIVLLAMTIDLLCGLYKARQRGQIRSSWGLKRSITKFITYEGGMLIAAGVDLLIHFSNLLDLFGLVTLQGVPLVTCLIGIFLLVVEFISVRETADEKTLANMNHASDTIAQAVSRIAGDEVVKQLLVTLLQENRKEARHDSAD